MLGLVIVVIGSRLEDSQRVKFSQINIDSFISSK